MSKERRKTRGEEFREQGRAGTAGSDRVLPRKLIRQAHPPPAPQHIPWALTLTHNGVFSLHWNQIPPGFHTGIRGPWPRHLERQCPIAPTKPQHKRHPQALLMGGLETVSLSLGAVGAAGHHHLPRTPIVSQLSDESRPRAGESRAVCSASALNPQRTLAADSK